MEKIAIAVLSVIVLLLVSVVYKIKKENEKIKLDSQTEISNIKSHYETKINEINTANKENIISIRNQCDCEIKRIKEEIESRKEILLQMEEKELLARVMMALDGYGTRFERIEKQLTDNSLLEKTNSMISELSSHIDDSISTLTNISSSVDTIISTITDEYEYDSLAYKIDDILSYVRNID